MKLRYAGTDTKKPIVHFVNCIGKDVGSLIVSHLSASFPDYQFVDINAHEGIDVEGYFSEIEDFGSPLAVIISGSMSSVNDDEHWIAAVKELARTAMDPSHFVPLLGVCFGHQIIAQVAGAKVESDSRHHEGMVTLELQQDIEGLAPKAAKIACYAYHQDIVLGCPSSFHTLLSGDGVINQGMTHNTLPIMTHQATLKLA
ncbi:type 1 glutamine amidotransferase [Enterovibrio coralii]|uniref:Glutamine amidotransferase domain-containing protein n=1 Tax=Enterovibrio coralii TaxID=294935 RepID=A0A135I518_9GAMM|nr:hypothetical protein [Enterovibrio coralii]KXF80533.1 hypothetical protein ATN88_07555 [Enterovibrio coralii]